jgi:hypothetical protein
MNDSREAMRDYLRVRPGCPWKWDDGGRVLVWEDGTTIVFREEVDAIVERLSARGLPPFASIVLLLAAGRGKFPHAPNFPTNAPPAQSLLGTLALRNRERALIELRKLAELPPSLRESIRGKAGLVEAVFEGRPGLPAGESLGLLGALATAFEDSELNTTGTAEAPFDINAALWVIADGVRRHTVASLQQRMTTGLEVLPGAAPAIELPPDQRARRLLGELAQEPEHAGLAAAARDLMAAIRLPSVLAEPEEIALGGSSGLGNRGPLDRLVLSELAHDDLTLATRIALNEALYIQREPPSLRPEHALVLVLDTGLRMWGVPRVIATSAALAFAATHHSTGPIRAWRGRGRELESVDLLSKEGLTDHLGVLSPELDIRAALVDGALADGGMEEDDVVLVTHRDAFNDPEFQLAASRVPGERKFVLTVDYDGTAALYPLPWGRPRPLGETRVKIESLFPANETNSPSHPLTLFDEAHGELPAVVRANPFPLLQAVNTSVDCSIPVGQGGICLTADRRLLRWTKPNRGAAQLATDLPGGRLISCQYDAAGRFIAVRGRVKDGKMSVIILPRDAAAPFVTRFPGPQAPLATFVEREVVLVILHTRVAVVSLETGELLGETDFPPGMGWISGRYFSPGVGLQFASWNGVSVQWDALQSARDRSRREIALAFERKGTGAWVILHTGAVLSPAGQEIMHCGFKVMRASVDARGHPIFVWDAQGNRHAIDEGGSVARKAPETLPKSSLAQARSPTRPTTQRFDAIRGGGSQPLSLRRPKNGQWLDIVANHQQHLRLQPATGRPADYPAGIRQFAPAKTLSAFGCELAEASWPDGSRVWLDRRGMLHLKSSQADLPELTLVLADPVMAAWSSDGGLGGPPFFTDQDAWVSTGFAADILKRFCTRL